MALCFIISGWDAGLWADEMAALSPGLDLRIWPDAGDAGEIDYALVWKPPAGALASLPNLKAIFSLGAGVDHVFTDPELPENVPVVRIVDPDLTARMSEYVVLHVLLHHRKQRVYDQFQRDRVWKEMRQPAAGDVRVGIMGLGVLGSDAARRLRDLGFQVAGWSHTQKHIDGIASFAGEAALDAFLNRTDILVCLLPHTPETEGMLNGALFAKLAQDGPLDGPCLINAGRGKVQREADIVAALEAGVLWGVTLDVFEHEPLPDDSPLWAHPRVTVTPHNAAASDARALASVIWRQIERHRAGHAFEHVVSRERGY